MRKFKKVVTLVKVEKISKLYTFRVVKFIKKGKSILFLLDSGGPYWDFYK